MSLLLTDSTYCTLSHLYALFHQLPRWDEAKYVELQVYLKDLSPAPRPPPPTVRVASPSGADDGPPSPARPPAMDGWNTAEWWSRF